MSSVPTQLKEHYSACALMCIPAGVSGDSNSMILFVHMMQPQANFLPDGDAPRQKDLVKMPGLQGKNYGKTTYNYPDYTKTESGLQYKDVKTGSGESPQEGDRVVFDWLVLCL